MDWGTPKLLYCTNIYGTSALLEQHKCVMRSLSVLFTLQRYKGLIKRKTGERWTIGILKGDYFHQLRWGKGSLKDAQMTAFLGLRANILFQFGTYPAVFTILAMCLKLLFCA